jgi:HD superfamily phosphohydrolase
MSLCMLRVLGVCHSMFIVRDSLHSSLYFHHVIVVLEAYLLHFIIFVFVALRCNLDLVGF